MTVCAIAGETLVALFSCPYTEGEPLRIEGMDHSVWELEIENFSCWNSQIHDEGIGWAGLYLFPRGIEGHGEHLIVKICDSWYLRGSGGVTLVASDGSTICTLSVESWDSDGDWLFQRGPRFSEVVDRIKEKEHLHKDRLTLRWKSKFFDTKYQYLRSTIRVYDTSVELDSTDFDDLKTEDWQHILSLEIKQCGKCSVSACKNKTKNQEVKIKLIFQSGEAKQKCLLFQSKKCLFRINFSLKKADCISKIFEDDFLLEKNEEQIFSFLQPRKGDSEKIFLTLKPIDGTINFSDECSNHPRTVLNQEVTNPSFSTSPQNNVPDNPNALVSNLAGNAVTVLAQDIGCLYQDHDFSDFELRCGGVSFPTHKNILSARSPFLKAMLSGDMREAASGQMDVDDLDPHTLGRFLAFLYSGAPGGEVLGWEEAMKLYYAADKYKVPSLKSECLRVLCDSVSLENVCDILSLGDRHQDMELTSAAHNFILKNYNEVLGSEEWEGFSTTNPSLLLKTLTHFAKSNCVFTKKT